MKAQMRGFTLVELMVVVALVAIVASIAVPSFQAIIANSRLSSSTNDLVGVLNFARSEAIRRGRSVTVSPSVGSNWANGASVWMDANDDGAMQAAEEMRRTPAAPGDVSVTSSQTSFRFTGGGLASSAVSIDVCDGRAGETGSQITVTIGGRIRSEGLPCS